MSSRLQKAAERLAEEEASKEIAKEAAKGAAKKKTISIKVPPSTSGSRSSHTERSMPLQKCPPPVKEGDSQKKPRKGNPGLEGRGIKSRKETQSEKSLLSRDKDQIVVAQEKLEALQGPRKPRYHSRA